MDIQHCSTDETGNCYMHRTSQRNEDTSKRKTNFDTCDIDYRKLKCFHFVDSKYCVFCLGKDTCISACSRQVIQIHLPLNSPQRDGSCWQKKNILLTRDFLISGIPSRCLPAAPSSWDIAILLKNEFYIQIERLVEREDRCY